MNGLTIEIIKDEAISTERTDFFFVKVNGEVFLECMNQEEVETLTIGGIAKLWEEMQ